jgi:hypothetical protein
MRVWKALAPAAALSVLVGSAALAQEMGGAMGPGSNYGYTPQPNDYGYTAQAYSGQGYAVRGFGPFESNADANARMVPSNNYCVTRERSGERSGTFIGADGRRHLC